MKYQNEYNGKQAHAIQKMRNFIHHKERNIRSFLKTDFIRNQSFRLPYNSLKVTSDKTEHSKKGSHKFSNIIKTFCCWSTAFESARSSFQLGSIESAKISKSLQPIFLTWLSLEIPSILFPT